MKTALLSLALLLAGASCTTHAVPETTLPEPTVAIVSEGGPVVLGEGGSVRVAWSGVLVTVAEIVDGRCPPEEMCIREGEVLTTLEFEGDTGTVERHVLDGVNAGQGQTAYGEKHWTSFDLVEVSVESLDDEGNVTVYFGIRD